MDQKIVWYQEVLELEPSSRVFFPLARLLLNEGHRDYAIDVLKKGLCHHKDFFEARLLLIELLHNAGDAEACDAEVRTLLAFFADYPQFWNAWGACLAHDGVHNDVSLAMRFIAASQTYSDISFSSLLDKGLQSLEKKDALPVQDAHLDFVQEQSFESTLLPLHIEDADMICDVAQGHDEEIESVVDSVDIVQPIDYADFLLQEGRGETAGKPFAQDLDDVSVYNTQILEAPCSSEFESYDETVLPQCTLLCNDENSQEDNVSAELFTLRTRSMADVLVSQGDVQGALSIYRELLQKEKTESGRCEIQGCIDALQENKGCCEAIDAAHESCHGQEKLLQMLTLLADRLDSRAQ